MNPCEYLSLFYSKRNRRWLYFMHRIGTSWKGRFYYVVLGFGLVIRWDDDDGLLLTWLAVSWLTYTDTHHLLLHRHTKYNMKYSIYYNTVSLSHLDFLAFVYMKESGNYEKRRIFLWRQALHKDWSMLSLEGKERGKTRLTTKRRKKWIYPKRICILSLFSKVYLKCVFSGKVGFLYVLKQRSDESHKTTFHWGHIILMINVLAREERQGYLSFN